MPFHVAASRRLSCTITVAALAAMLTPIPAAAQGLLGRIKRTIEQAEQTVGEVEQATAAAERVMGTRKPAKTSASQTEMPADPTWSEEMAAMGSPTMGSDTMDQGGMGAGSADMPPNGDFAGSAGASLTLYSRFDYLGNSVTVNADAPSLHILDINFGDKSYSLIANGPWELCKDSRFRGECRVFEGRVANLGDFRGVASSARYLGPQQ